MIDINLLKIRIVALFLFLLNNLSFFAQANRQIQLEVDKQLNKWKQKSTFESDIDYNQRLNTKLEETKSLLNSKIYDSIRNFHLELKTCSINLDKYDANNEMLPIAIYYLSGSFNDEIEKILHTEIKLPKNIASKLSENYNTPFFKPSKVSLLNDNWVFEAGVFGFLRLVFLGFLILIIMVP